MRWLRSVFLRCRHEREMREEMSQHLERATARLMARGLSSEEARAAALREFGNVHYLQEKSREARGARWLEALTPDAKLALRMLVKNPVLSLVGGLGMAVAIAIGTGFFTFMTFYYSDAPVEDGDRVVTVEYIQGDGSLSRAFDYRVWKDELESVEDLAAYRTVTRNLESPISRSGRAKVAEMTASGFRVARVSPLLGRPLLDSDEVEGAPPVVVIGFREWHQHFAADAGVLGREVRLDRIVHTVVGVMPESFRLPVNHGFWTALKTGTAVDGTAEGPQLHVFGRLAPRVDQAAAAAEVAAIGQRLTAEYPQIYDRYRGAVLPYIRHVFDVQQYPGWSIWLMQLFAGLILALVAVNVAVLVYARTALRRAEITVRAALGASRSRIVTQLFVEALALSAAAAVLGLVIAQVGFRQMTTLVDLRDNFPYWLFGSLPPHTIVYAAGVAILAAFIVGVLPALQATGRHLQSTLRQLGSGAGLQMGKTWTVLICVQVAVAVGILPAVLGVAWNNSFPPRPVFPASEILSFQLQPPAPAPGNPASGGPGSGADFASQQAELLRRVEALPGVAAVTFASSLPLRGRGVFIEVEGVVDVTRTTSAASHQVDPRYFDAFDVPLLAGRTFDRRDVGEGTSAAIVNRSFVESYFGDGDALGRRFREAAPASQRMGSEASVSGAWLEVVGVVEDMVRPSRRGRPVPALYRPIDLGATPLSLAAHIRGADPSTVASRVREVAGDIAPGHALTLAPMEAYFREDSDELRFLLLMVGLVTLSVLLLSAAGISAMMSFAVTRRQREMGIRTALGASRGQVVMSIFSKSTRQLAVGLLIGAAAAGGLDRLTGGAMLGGQTGQLLGIVAAIMLVCGLLASLGPARRALRIQPMMALREE